MALKYTISAFMPFVSHPSNVLLFWRLFADAADEATFNVLRLENLADGSQFLDCCLQLSFTTSPVCQFPFGQKVLK